jgi:hypothetical protein
MPLISLVFGHIYKPVANPFEFVDPNTGKKSKLKNLVFSHRWAMFFSINNDHDLTEKYIRSVTYVLDNVYSHNSITITEPPYILSRSDYG